MTRQSQVADFAPGEQLTMSICLSLSLSKIWSNLMRVVLYRRLGIKVMPHMAIV